jgi:hypothetical protein
MSTYHAMLSRTLANIQSSDMLPTTMKGKISDTTQCASEPFELEENSFEDVVHVPNLIFC